jgi:peptide/nickel transport system permease protein
VSQIIDVASDRPDGSTPLSLDGGHLAAEAQEPDRQGRRFALHGGVGLWLAVGWLGLVLLLAVMADLLPLQDPLRTDPRNTEAAPGLDHWFGTDTVGRDMLARCIFGARVSLFIGACSACLAAAIGSTLGFIAGYFRGRVEGVLVSTMDAMLAFPALILALALTAFLGASQRNVIIAITVVAIPVFGRLVRGQTLSIREREFVLASRASGASDMRTLLTEVVPNVAPAIAAYAVLLAAVAIVVEGSLSFLGLGVPLPTPTWGSVISSGQGELDTAPHISAFPAAAIFLTVFALNTIGDWLRDRFEVGGSTR